MNMIRLDMEILDRIEMQNIATKPMNRIMKKTILDMNVVDDEVIETEIETIMVDTVKTDTTNQRTMNVMFETKEVSFLCDYHFS